MGKFICVGTNIKFTSDNATAVVNITGTPSNKVLCNNLPVWFGEIGISVSAATQGSFTQIAPSSGSIIASGTKVLSNNKQVVVVGDKTASPVICTLSDTQGNTITLPVTVTVADGGQNKVSTI